MCSVVSGSNSFHLEWNNHLGNMQAVLESLFTNQSLVDVTVACRDGVLKAHKVILSACSPYFEAVFRETPCKHPVLILKGVNVREMQALLHFMYRGQVDVPETELSALVATACEFKVKGFSMDGLPSADEYRCDSASEHESEAEPSLEIRQPREFASSWKDEKQSETGAKLCEKLSEKLSSMSDEVDVTPVIVESQSLKEEPPTGTLKDEDKDKEQEGEDKEGEEGGRGEGESGKNEGGRGELEGGRGEGEGEGEGEQEEEGEPEDKKPDPEELAASLKSAAEKNSELQDSKSPELEQKESLVCILSVATLTKEEWVHEENEEKGEVENMEGEEERNDADSEAKNEITLLEDGDPLDDLSYSAGSEIYFESIVEVTNQSPSSTNEITPSASATIPDFTDDLKDCVGMSSKGGKGYVTVYSPKVVMEDFSVVFQDQGFGIERTIIDVLPDSVENTQSSYSFQLGESIGQDHLFNSQKYPEDVREELVELTNRHMKEKLQDCCTSSIYGQDRDQIQAVETSCAGSKDDKAYTCPKCDTVFSVKSSFVRHLSTHTGQRPYACSMCELKFSKKSNLNVHLRTHTGGKPYHCSVCEMKFTKSYALKRHMRSHTGEKPYSCSVCELKLSKKSTLNVHLRTHTGEKPFECSVCGTKFSEKSRLARHIRTIHTGEKPYECSLCVKKFSRKSQLGEHFCTHTGEKPFACSMCVKKFARKSNRDIHYRTHTGEKPFACSMCVMKFARKSHRDIHYRTHTGENKCVNENSH